MVRIGTVWDRTTDVLAGRGGMLAGLAALFLFLPDVARGALLSFGGTGEAAALARIPLSLALLVLLVMGILALTAVASDPAVTQRDAVDVSVRRLGPAIGVVLVMVVVAMLALIPVGALIAVAGVAVDPVTGDADVSRANTGMLGAAGLLLLVLAILGLWVSARLVPLMAVVVNERRGLGAFGRSFALTRGAGLRLVGVLLLYAVVLLVVIAALGSVIGVFAALLLGPEQKATVDFVASVASALVTAAATVVQTVFYTQFYVAARAAEGASPPPPLA